jgi:hypothetical protein
MDDGVSMPSVLMLAVRMCLGHGVSVVVCELADRLARRGVEVIIGCCEFDEAFASQHAIERVSPTVAAIRALSAQRGVGLVVAHEPLLRASS